MRIFAALLSIGLIGTSLPAQSTQDLTEAENRTPISFELVQTIGSLNGEHDAFGTILDVAIDSRQNLYVADRGRPQVSIFDWEGNFVRTIGRAGEGPGEFANPSRIALGRGDTIYVLDRGLGRISRFAPSGEFINSEGIYDPRLVNDLAFLPDGHVVLSGVSRPTRTAVHVLDHELQVIERFADLAMESVPDFWESVLGGYIDVTPAGLILYTQKSPFELRLYEPTGRLTWVCRGLGGVTTPPNDVIDITPQRRRLEWTRFTHSAEVFALSDLLFLNVITDPTQDQRRIDLIDRRCQQRATTLIEAPMNFRSARSIDGHWVFVGARTLDYPEIIIYRLRMPASP